MTEILQDMLYTSIAIFDNFLIVCDDYNDLFEKFNFFLTICANRNVILGMPKSKIGFRKCTFFGFEIFDGKYQLTQSRKDAVASLVFPKTQKQVQSFLGSCVFFRNNILNYADKCAPLHDMSKKSFSWDEKTWLKDYRTIFEVFKADILNAIAVNFPDNSLSFVLRTDASKVAWGGVLLQVTKGGTYECISLASAKFSDIAYRWDIQKKVTYAIVASIKHMQCILTGKYFIIEIDNKNATYMRNATSCIAVRWNHYIQSFHNCTRFIQGKYNTSDWLTRQNNLYNLSDDSNANPNPEEYDSEDYILQVLNLLVSHSESDEITEHSAEAAAVARACRNTTHTHPGGGGSQVVSNVSTIVSVDDMFKRVHGGVNFHRGALQTWKDLNKEFPGHKVPLRVIQDMVAECTTCQIARLGMEHNTTFETNPLP
jgi:hypothetical protein